jgi:predicted CXXCH cytochrome family protein
MMIAAIAAVEERSRLLGFLGNLHPGIVHFPIGLLAAAAILEGWQILRKKPGPSPATLPLTVLAALTGPVAALFGWLLSEYEASEGSTVELHKWLGLSSTAIAIFAAVIAKKAATSPGALKALRSAVFIGSALVLATGYLGGEMARGPGHLMKFFSPSAPTSSNGKEPLFIPSDKIDFEHQIAPILKASCLKCHNPVKTKGKLLLDTKANALKGGDGGKVIIPGKPQDSPLYTLLIDTDPDVRMPEKAGPLPKEQIELIRKWIEQGAVWPDGFVVK